MTALTSIRWSLTSHLVDLLRNDPTLLGVSVEPGWPGAKHVTAEMVWVDELAGDVAIPLAVAGRKPRDDDFTIPFELRVAGMTTLDETMARVSELVAAIENVLANDPTLGDFDGLIDAEITSERMTAGETPESGYVGFAEVVVSCHSRLI